MWKTPKDVLMLNKFGKYAKVAGTLFMLLGLVGILFPLATSLVTVVFVASLLFFGRVIAGYFTYMTDRGDVLGWLKSILLIGVSFYMIYYPLGGVVTLGMLLSIYFFMDAFTSFSMGLSAGANKGRWYWIINAALSLLIAIYLVVNIPLGTMFMIGLLVGFSLFFDGLALFMGAKVFGDFDKDLKA